MQPNNRLFDDLARVANGAFGAMSGVRDEVELRVREGVERLLGEMNLVTREEFDALRAQLNKARAEQLALSERLAALEARLAAPGDASEPR